MQDRREGGTEDLCVPPGAKDAQAHWRRRQYFRFTLSIRHVEELLARRGIEVSREAARCRVYRFGPLMAASLRRGRGSPTGQWHLDEMAVKIRGRRLYL